MANADDYRDKVFGVLPNLFFLDGKDRDGQDAPDDEGVHYASVLHSDFVQSNLLYS